jgi:chemotaxis protein histidine kinase CheA
MAQAESEALAEQQQAMQEAAERLQQELGQSAPQTPQTQSLSQVLQQLAEQMQGMGQTARQNMAEALEDAMQIVSSGTPELSETRLREAAQSLQEGNLEAPARRWKRRWPRRPRPSRLAQAYQPSGRIPPASSRSPGTASPASSQKIASQAAEQAEESARAVAVPGPNTESLAARQGRAARPRWAIRRAYLPGR